LTILTYLPVLIVLIFFSFNCGNGKTTTSDHEDIDIQVTPDVELPDNELDDASVSSICGNGIVEGSEECDDGNDIDGDGCDSDCKFSCHNDNECNDGNDCTDDYCIEGSNGKLCIYTNMPEGTECDDGDPCNINDECDGMGNCVGTPTGLTNCGGECVDLSSDPEHCGDCFTSCLFDEDCINGTCVVHPWSLVGEYEIPCGLNIPGFDNKWNYHPQCLCS